MKFKTKYRYHNYVEASEKFIECKKLGATNMTYDYPTQEYIIELVREVHSEPEFMRFLLSDIKLDYELSADEIDALAYADSAIKTLQDMGVIK